MSGQAKRSRVLAMQRWRKQAVRMAVEFGDCHVAHDGHLYFDVALLRERCGSIIADARARADERIVFTDWTREFGKGPENRERGAFCKSPRCEGGRIVGDFGQLAVEALGRAFAGGRFGVTATSDGPAVTCHTCADLEGGWPGPLAREWGTVPCEACEGRGRLAFTWSATQDEGQICECAGWAREIGEPERMFASGKALTLRHAKVCPKRPGRCERCRGRGRVPRPGRRRDAPAGPGLSRTAQRLLDALDGRCPWNASAQAQPSECQSRYCIRGMATRYYRRDLASGAPSRSPCPVCSGTGHNLRGYLPEVEYSHAVVRTVADALVAVLPTTNGDTGLNYQWQREVYERERERVDALLDGGRQPLTRSVPRNEHRQMNAEQGERCTLADQVRSTEEVVESMMFNPSSSARGCSLGFRGGAEENYDTISADSSAQNRGRCEHGTRRSEAVGNGASLRTQTTDGRCRDRTTSRRPRMTCASRT